MIYQKDASRLLLMEQKLELNKTYDYEINTLHPITDYLYHTSLEGVQNTVQLKNMNITTVISVMNADHFNQWLYEAQTIDKLKVHHFNIEDNSDANIIDVALKVHSIIEEVKNKGEKIVCHCHAGISRSTSVIIAHLCLSQKISVKQALNHIQSIRKVALPNEGFLEQLESYFLQNKI